MNFLTQLNTYPEGTGNIIPDPDGPEPSTVPEVNPGIVPEISPLTEPVPVPETVPETIPTPELPPSPEQPGQYSGKAS